IRPTHARAKSRRRIWHLSVEAVSMHRPPRRTFPISSARRPTAASKLLELLEAAEARPAVRRKISTPRLAGASPPAPGQSNGSRLRSRSAAADFADRWELPPLQERLP